MYTQTKKNLIIIIILLKYKLKVKFMMVLEHASRKENDFEICYLFLKIFLKLKISDLIKKMF